MVADHWLAEHLTSDSKELLEPMANHCIQQRQLSCDLLEAP